MPGRARKLVSAALFATLFAAEAAALDSMCRTGCAAGTSDCTRIPGSAIGFDLRDPLAALRQALADATRESIPSKEMLGMFGLSNDPCARSSTSLAQSLRNEGNLCTLTTTYTSDLIGQSVEVRVAMPRILSGGLARDGQAATVDFGNRQQSPHLDLNDPVLANLLTGRVERVEFFSDAVFAVIAAVNGKMCVELKFAE